MRILYHHRILARDGMRVHIAEIVAALRRRGHTVVVLGPDSGADAAGGAHARAGVGLAGWLGRLRGHVPVWLGEGLELAYNLAAWARLRRAVRTHRPDVIYERYNLFLLAGVWLKRLHGVPLLLEVNAPLAEERAVHGALTLRALARWAERHVWRNADMVLPVSHALAAHIRAAGVPDSRITVIPNGAHLDARPGEGERDALRADLGLTGKVVVGFVGFVRPWHGLERVLDAFAAADRSDLHLLVVGTGPAVADLESRAAALGLTESLTVTGAVSHAAVTAYLAVFDVALQPDVTPYASPLKLVEYMAAGCAIVAPDRANVRELVAPDDSALLVPPGDAAALGAAIRRLASDPGLRARLGAAARRTLAERGQTWDGNADRIAAAADRCGFREHGSATQPAAMKT
jgi:glycosyltransferase involved in cell wall biosynthesis